MKKIMIVFLMFIPFIANAGSDLDIRNQMLDSEIERLTKQRDERYDALKKCEKSTKGFKIAGITTLVATGVGVYGNIKLSQKLKGKGNVGSRSSLSGNMREDTCAKDPICSWERQCEMQGYKVQNCDHDKDCCAADGCPCEK